VWHDIVSGRELPVAWSDSVRSVTDKGHPLGYHRSDQEMQRTFSQGVGGMPIQSRLSAGTFTPEQVRVIVAAFDGALLALQASGSHLAGVPYSTTVRDLLAKRIIDKATNGLLDVEALKADALAHVREQLPPPG
jgi:hypothetical protein